MTSSFSILALTPSGFLDPAIAIAACRAGGTGVLDLVGEGDLRQCREAIDQLCRHARSRCGLKLESRSALLLPHDGDREDLAALLGSASGESIGLVILTPAEEEILKHGISLLRREGRLILLEATCLEEARLGERLAVDGLIAKGHESGGRIGEETSFVLLQRFLDETSLPVWVQGGIGLHTASACYTSGASGIVLDAQLLLARESPLPDAARATIARMDGSETVCLGGNLGESYRVIHRRGDETIASLHSLANQLAEPYLHISGRSSCEASQEPTHSSLDSPSTDRSEALGTWRGAVRRTIGWGDGQIWPLGQDGAFAATLAARYRTVGGILEGLRCSIDIHVRTAKDLLPLGEGAPLALSHGTRYPIVQGPMTRVSDTAAFADVVARAGGLPFLALALLKAPEAGALLRAARAQLGDRPWGVGILGFVPQDLRQEQMAVIREHRPSFALIAGGRPDQALDLEKAGIPTYLHVPSPGLLRLFIESGARRFVFEGRECGGHVGPRSSFVLWETMIETLLDGLSPDAMAECHVLFAGGIHDARSAAMVAAMAAPLAQKGGKIGVLLGTAYLFTQDALTSGAIVPGFQREAVECDRTVLLETGPGHASRCAYTPYVEVFERRRRELVAEGRPPEEIREELERLNLGRLRIAAKGVDHLADRERQAPGLATMLCTMSEEEQGARGMYMVGQVAALRRSIVSVETLHHDVSVEGSRRLSDRADPSLSYSYSSQKERPCDIAIVGMACVMPKASDLAAYWENIINRIDAITEIPSDRFDWQRYYDPNVLARDKIASRWGGFIDDVPFDPVRYGMPPSSLLSIEPLQLLTLEVARKALEDAGYAESFEGRERASVILGVGGGIGDLGCQYAVRSALPSLPGNLSPDLYSVLPEWTEDSFAGILLNVAAGRVANRFDLGGVNYTVDAACASSLAAVYCAARELEAGTSDIVIVGGIDTVQNPFGYLCFSKTRALSPNGKCRTFDAKANGIVISEGVAVLIMKRLNDAERNGDRIYAVLKGIAGSSDGKARGMTAPRPEGQVAALKRAYAKAGFSPGTVGLIEAHGTGTVAGDRAEVEALKRAFEADGAARQSCAIGSVKSMIGHTKCAAGVAGLIKVALALYHKTLPPTLNVDCPNPEANFPESPFYVNSEARPWLLPAEDIPRRAGVSAFGFGGTNFHAVLEEYASGPSVTAPEAGLRRWPSELMVWAGRSTEEIRGRLHSLAAALDRGAHPELADLACSIWATEKARFSMHDPPTARLAIVASSLEDCRQQLHRALSLLEAPSETAEGCPPGIFFTDRPLALQGKVAFLFPGQGSQYPGMLGDLSLRFPEVREPLECADRILADRLNGRLSAFVFPPPSFTPQERRERQQALTRTDIAQPALGAASMGMLGLLRSMGIRPDMVAGHSYGEYVALCCAGAIDERELYLLSEARGRCIRNVGDQDLGTMAVALEGEALVRDLLGSLPGVWIANINAPRQVVLSGSREAVGNAVALLEERGIQTRSIPVACAFHSPLIASARDRLAAVLAEVPFRELQLDVFSNATAEPYPRDPQAIAALLGSQLVSPVRFVEQTEAMYRAGARIFIEVGPRGVLTGLVRQILGDRPHLALAADGEGRDSLLELHHVLGWLVAHGLCIDLDRLYRGRSLRSLRLEALEEETQDIVLSPTTWLVNGGRARPVASNSTPATPPDMAKVEDASLHLSPTPSAVCGVAPDSEAWGRTDLNRVSPAEETRRNGKEQAMASHTPAATSPSARSTSHGEGPSPPSSNGDRHDPLGAPKWERAIPGGIDVLSETPAAAPAGAEIAQVMLGFQQLMNRFLETQQQVMLSYLQSGAPAESLAFSSSDMAGVLPAHATPPMRTEPVAPAHDTSIQAVPVAAANDATPAEASPWGTSSVRSMPASAGASPAGDTPPAMHQRSLLDRPQLTSRLLQIVSDRTGYPAEMLDCDLNIEADLGVDSIKRVEILGVFQRDCLSRDADATKRMMERWSGIKTLNGIIDAVLAEADAYSTAPSEVPSGGLEASPAARERRGADGAGDLPRFLHTPVDAPLNGEGLS